MKRSIYIALTVFIGIMLWTIGELIIFGSSMNGNESALLGLAYFFFVVFCTYATCADIHYRMRPRNATRVDQSRDLCSLVHDDLYMSTNERLG